MSRLTSVALVLRLSLGLAILYGAVIIVWFELLRSLVVRRRVRRREASSETATATVAPGERERREPADSDGRVAAQTAATESELERARRHYYLARKEARSGRDAAIAAANEAAEEAIQRIERRYREIDEAFVDEETERINELLRRRSEDAP